MQAIDISSIRPLGEFEADMEQMIDNLKSASRAPGVEEIFYPGEIEARNEAVALVEGIALPDSTAEDLLRQAKVIGVMAPF